MRPDMVTMLFVFLYALLYSVQCKPWTAEDNEVEMFQIAIIADMDRASRVGDQTWFSLMMNGTLSYDRSNKVVTFAWNSMMELTTNYSEEQRGAELSELIMYDGRLLTVGDQTGIVYEIVDGKLVPWVFLENEADGTGFKGEWMTIKDDELYVGSHGYPIFTPEGVPNKDRQYVKKISREGVVQSIDWSNNYNNMMAYMEIVPPDGYITHEAVCYSTLYSTWVFLPRRVSSTPYDEYNDERSGANLLFYTTDFNRFGKIPLGNLEPTRGFSAFRFIPNTYDSALVALKTYEVGGDIATYIAAYDINGNTLMEETLVYIGIK